MVIYRLPISEISKAPLSPIFIKSVPAALDLLAAKRYLLNAQTLDHTRIN